MENKNLGKQTIVKSLRINAFLNIIRQCGNIIFPLITYPYITRVLGVDNLGKYSFANSIIQYVLLFGGLGINVYAVREGARIRENREKIQEFSNDILSINILATIISLLICSILVVAIESLHNYWFTLLIMSINVILAPLAREWLNSIYEDYTYISIKYLFFQLLSLFLIFTFVHDSSDYLKYIIITVIGTSGGYICSFFYTQKYLKSRFFFTSKTKTRIKSILKLFVSSLALQIYINSDITMIGLLRSETEVGIYTLSSRIYLILKALLNAMIIVAIPRLSYFIGNGNYEGFHITFGKLKKILELFVLPCISGTIILSDDIMRLIGGYEYLGGATSLRVLCIAMFFAVFGCLYSQGYLIVLKKDNIFVMATIVGAVLNILLNCIMIPMWGINGAAVTTVISEIVVFYFCRKKSESEVKKNDRDIISIIAGILFLDIICFFLQRKISFFVIRIILSIILGGIGYFTVLVIMKNGMVIHFIKRFVANWRKNNIEKKRK